MTLDLHDFIRNKMRMTHIYQPVMIKVLLENSGEATVEQIAASILSYDQSQLEYYGLRTKNMVGRVLTNNSVVQPIKSGQKITGYKLNTDGLTEAQTASLVCLCEEHIDGYINKRSGQSKAAKRIGTLFTSIVSPSRTCVTAPVNTVSSATACAAKVINNAVKIIRIG